MNTNVINNMIKESINNIIKDGKVDEDKLEIITGLIFEHIFHRTYTFVSDELDQFRELIPISDNHKNMLNKHNNFINWSAPIVFEANKIMRQLKKIGIVFSVIFTLSTGIYESYNLLKDYIGYEVNIHKVQDTYTIVPINENIKDTNNSFPNIDTH